MTTRLPPLRPNEFTADQAALYAAITGGPRARGRQHFSLTAPDGSLRGPFDAMLRSPAVGSAQQELGAAIRYRTGLTDRARELAILLVAARWSSTFEKEAHEAVARGIGFADDELTAISGEDVSGFADAEGVVGRTTLMLLDGDLSDAGWDAAADTLGIAALFELTALVGYYSTLALQLRVFRV